MSPAQYAVDLARAKAAAVAERLPDAVVLGADTVVILDGDVLGKPRDPDEAMSMLRRLNGRRHEVVTGVALAGAAGESHDLETTRVTFRRYSVAEMKSYVAGGSPMDKAGAYGIQDAELAPARRIEGCYLNVVGLPMCAVRRMLLKAGTLVPEAAP
jgi:MAF protein